MHGAQCTDVQHNICTSIRKSWPLTRRQLQKFSGCHCRSCSDGVDLWFLSTVELNFVALSRRSVLPQSSVWF